MILNYFSLLEWYLFDTYTTIIFSFKNPFPCYNHSLNSGDGYWPRKKDLCDFLYCSQSIYTISLKRSIIPTLDVPYLDVI